METEYEKQQRLGAEYIANRDANIARQTKEKGWADDYAKKQEEFKKMGLAEETPDDKGRTEGYNHIVQSASIFNNKSISEQQKLTNDFVANNKIAETQENLRAYGIGQDSPSEPGGYQTVVDGPKLTNQASVLSQSAQNRRLSYQLNDEALVSQIEAADDPLKAQRLKLERNVHREQYEVETSHGAANASRLLKDEKASDKFSGLADKHEQKRDWMLERLAEFDKAHPEHKKQRDQERGSEQNAVATPNKSSTEHQQSTPKGNDMSEKKELSANQKTLEGVWAASAEKTGVKPIDPEHKERVKASREEIRVADQQKEQSRSKEREQER